MPAHFVIITKLLTYKTSTCGKGFFIRKNIITPMNNVLKGFKKENVLEACHMH